jgi:hypothetical protein
MPRNTKTLKWKPATTVDSDVKNGSYVLKQMYFNPKPGNGDFVSLLKSEITEKRRFSRPVVL